MISGLVSSSTSFYLIGEYEGLKDKFVEEIYFIFNKITLI
jgi:hypothetical protein